MIEEVLSKTHEEKEINVATAVFFGRVSGIPRMDLLNHMAMNQKSPKSTNDNLSPAQREMARRKAMRHGNQPPDRRGLWMMLTIGVFAIIIVGGAIVIDNRQSQQRLAPQQTAEAFVQQGSSQQITSTLASEILGLQAFSVEQGHTPSKVNYPQMPPAGGVHNPVWQNCGIYDAPIEAINAVHSMEHGATWVVYRPDIGQPEIDALRSLVRGRPYTLLSPMADASAPVVAAAWGFRLELTNTNDPRLAQFVSKFTNGPQTPEPGASCSGAKGQPLG